jgi:GR25 family glycosyltransferase involved in LPS biosynthesis
MKERKVKRFLSASTFLTHCLSSFLLFATLGTAAFDDHLKKAEGKSDLYKMRNIDFIYMINLDRRPEKFAQSSSELGRYGITPYRFSAVNGWELTPQIINEMGLPYRSGMTQLLATTYPIEANGAPSHEFMTHYGTAYFCHCMAKGTIGCAMSHISVIKDAWDSGYETIWVMEDDIEALDDPNLLSSLIEELDQLVGKDNWDVLFTDQDYRSGVGQYVVAAGAAKRPDMDCTPEGRTAPNYTLKQDISPKFRKISARFGAHSMIIRRSGIEKLLKFSREHKIFLPYDLENYLPEGIARYSLTYDLVTNLLGALTDNGIRGYEDH